MDRKESVILRRGQVEALLSLTSLKDVKTILSAIVSYGMDGVVPDIPDHLMFGWVGIKYSIDYDNSQYNGMVEKRRSAAQKRWSKQTDTNDASVLSALQVDANDANDAHIHIHNNNSLSPGARVCAYADKAQQIADAFPRAKVGDHRKLVLLVIEAVEREIDKGQALAEALLTVSIGTQNYAKAMAGKPKKFLAKPEDFYGKGQYNFDPEVWEHPENVKSGGKDVLQHSPQFAVNERGL